MAGRAGELLAFLRRAGPRGTPSGWALALDAAVAVGAAAAAVLEVPQGPRPDRVVKLGSVIVGQTVATHPAAATLVAAALTALPLAARRLYPITVWLVIVAAIGAVLVITLAATATFADTLPRFPGRLTALFAIVPAAAAGLGIRELRRRL